MAKIHAPVYGFYGGNDARISAAVPDVQEKMKAAGKTYDPVIYDGAGHGFMRSGDDPAGTPANVKARNEAFAKMKGLIQSLSK
jgi:carboxymethylenebutenolidase